MNSLPASVLVTFTDEVGKSAERIVLRIGLAVAGLLAAMIATAFLFAAAYTGLVMLVGVFAAQLGLAAIFAITASVLFRFASRATLHNSRPAAHSSGSDGPPYDDWAGRMAASVAYAFAEGLMRGRKPTPGGSAPPGSDGAT